MKIKGLVKSIKSFFMSKILIKVNYYNIIIFIELINTQIMMEMK